MTVRIIVGDVREVIKGIADDSVDIVCTSPPYYGLRDYDTASWVGGDPRCSHLAPMPGGTAKSGLGAWGTQSQRAIEDKVRKRQTQYKTRCHHCGASRQDLQIGLEPTLAEHIRVMVEVFREIRRVLKPSGTVWLNYGDCYVTSAGATGDRRGRSGNLGNGGKNGTAIPTQRARPQGGLKPKDLAMAPNRLAIALQEDGWFVRSEIIWAKSNPMPESVRDRPATAHEKIFMLTKAARYFYNGDAVRQPSSSDENANGFRGGSYVHDTPGPRSARGNYRRPNAPGKSPHGQGFSRRNSFARDGKLSAGDYGEKPQFRADRDPLAYEGLTRNLRNFEPAPVQVWNIATVPYSEAHFATFPPELAQRCLLAGCPPGGVVLDPFGGAGTVGLVAESMGLETTLIELGPKYAAMTRRRIKTAIHTSRVIGGGDDEDPNGLPLFGGPG